MSFKLLVHKLNMSKEKYIESSTIKAYSKTLNLDYYVAIRYLISNRYLYTILRGIFYKPSIEERKLNNIETNSFELIATALRIKRVKNWYLGLETAIKMNNLSHEHFEIDTIISDTIFRARPIAILGNKFKFVKLKSKLLTFGIHKKKNLNYSDAEKTVLDFVYLTRYGGLNNNEAKNKVYDLLEHCSKEKLIVYAKKYNNKISEFVANLK